MMSPRKGTQLCATKPFMHAVRHPHNMLPCDTAPVGCKSLQEARRPVVHGQADADDEHLQQTKRLFVCTSVTMKVNCALLISG